jgi:hypothetical protein
LAIDQSEVTQPHLWLEQRRPIVLCCNISRYYNGRMLHTYFAPTLAQRTAEDPLVLLLHTLKWPAVCVGARHM